MVDEKEATNDRCYDLNCRMEPETEAKAKNTGGLLLGGSSGGVSFGEGTSAEGLRTYKRRKRRKMSKSDELAKCEFDDKIKAAAGCAPDQDNHMLSFDAFTSGPGECSLRHCSNVVLEQMHQSHNGHEDGLVKHPQNTIVTYRGSGFMPVIKKSPDNVERSDNQTNSSAPEPSHVLPRGLLKQPVGSTSSELCLGLLSDILNSDKFSEICGLLCKNFGVVNVKQVLNIDAISSKIKNGAYETSPLLYLKDIQQVWTKLEQAGNEMVTLASILFEISGFHYDQFVRRKPQATEARGCQGCGEQVEVGKCLVCDSCEDVYHLSCTELIGTEIPPLSWYCASCVSNGVRSPHDNCIVCEKLKTSASIPNGVPTNDQSQDVPNGTDENQSSNICFRCKSEVKIGDDFKQCRHLFCPHRFYHNKCLTSKQLGACGSCWLCPSCLCRRCLVNKDDEQIVLCDCCDEAYHIYCTSPQLLYIPRGSWFCTKCDRRMKGLKTMKKVYVSMQKKVKIEDGSEKAEHEEAMDEREGLDMLVTAAKTLSYPDTFWNKRSSIL